MADKKDIILELNGSDDILTFQTIQGNRYKDGNLFEGPKSSWFGYSLLPEGISYQIVSTSKIPLTWIDKFNIFRFPAKKNCQKS